MIKFVCDMMGGDFGCKPSIEAIKKYTAIHSDVYFYCVGKKEELNELLNLKNIEIIDARDIMPMDADPLLAMKAKETSMIKSFETFKNKQCDAIISCGGTGAYLTAATFLVGRIKGVKRPCLVAPFPTVIKGKNVVLLDVGANSTCTSEELVQFAHMGKIYSKFVFGVESPKVSLLSNGTEDHKGTETIRATNTALRENEFENFQGNIEAREVLSGITDVVVCDGFSGNIFLKSSEGVFKIISNMLKSGFKSSLKTKIGYLLSKKVVRNISDTFNYKAVGGAMLLGVKGSVIKAHGNSDVESMIGAFNCAYKLSTNNVWEKIDGELNNNV